MGYWSCKETLGSTHCEWREKWSKGTYILAAVLVGLSVLSLIVGFIIFFIVRRRRQRRARERHQVIMQAQGQVWTVPAGAPGAYAVLPEAHAPLVQHGAPAPTYKV
ncbi:hypothetical protein BKA62DRAFT_767900 [Auriculariales sp. MPI-PUGE-AT-0066]|nr:hypothetical protein BKA62DRAFT_767900 [Auriculariales sp. MPI-PUGE-AT-0066]